MLPEDAGYSLSRYSWRWVTASALNFSGIENPKVLQPVQSTETKHTQKETEKDRTREETKRKTQMKLRPCATQP